MGSTFKEWSVLGKCLKCDRDTLLLLRVHLNKGWVVCIDLKEIIRLPSSWPAAHVRQVVGAAVLDITLVAPPAPVVCSKMQMSMHTLLQSSPPSATLSSCAQAAELVRVMELLCRQEHC